MKIVSHTIEITSDEYSSIIYALRNYVDIEVREEAMNSKSTFDDFWDYMSSEIELLDGLRDIDSAVCSEFTVKTKEGYYNHLENKVQFYTYKDRYQAYFNALKKHYKKESKEKTL